MPRPPSPPTRSRPPSRPPAGSQTVAQLIDDEAAIIGEKVELRRVRTLSGDKFEIYLHKTSKDLPPQVGVVLAYSGDDAETARSLAQHISFANPTYLSRDEVPAADVDKEREIVTEISRNEGKPEAALPKIVEGRVNAFFKQVALLDQDYAKDNKLSVAQVGQERWAHAHRLRPLQGRRVVLQKGPHRTPMRAFSACVR